MVRLPRESVSLLEQSLAAIYGEDMAVLSEQASRYAAALQRFHALFGSGPVSIFRAPGRVNLIGEHTDYNQGYVLPMALDKDTVILARRRADSVANVWNTEADSFAACTFPITNAIEPGPLSHWGNYVKASAQALALEAGSGLSGMDALVVGGAPWGIPRAAGLSSSSALVVASAIVLCSLSGVSMDRSELAALCSEAEWYVGTRGGIMDQFISIFAERGKALLLDCRPQREGTASHPEYAMRPVPLPQQHEFFIVNSAVAREKTRSQYNVRVAECRLAVALLRHDVPGITHLRDLSDVTLLTMADAAALIEALPEHISRAEVRSQPELEAVLQGMAVPFAEDQAFKPRPRARHVVSENARVLASVEALAADDPASFGRLMDESHASMSTDYEASCPEVDLLANLARKRAGILGARVTGAGWGGCVVALSVAGQSGVADQIMQEYRQQTGLPGDGFVCRSGTGAGLVASLEV